MDVEFDWLPKLGKTFNTVEEAWQFWIDYGGRMGFGVRKQYSNKNADGKILSLRFVCAKEGVRKSDKRDSLTVIPRLETRTNCGVKLGIRYIKGIEKYEIHDFFSEHNHPLHLSHTTHMLTCQRKISQVQTQEIEMADDSGITQRASFELMSRQVGGRENIGYTRLDQKNYLRTKRMKSMAYGEAGSLLAYFQQESLENPSFSHAIQLDLEEQITNIFWADAKMIMDYEYFGDVVTLDTTYSTNNACRPLAVFAGFNHFRGVVIFGAALLYDESSDSFEWLFRVFLKTHKNKKPRTIFTDQAAAMANGLAKYILKRWTRGAMRRLVKDMHGRIVEEDTCLTSTQWFKQTCPKLVRTVTQASDCKEARVFVEKAVEELSKKVDDICKLNLGLEINDTDSSLPIQCTNLQLLEVRGLKRRNGVRNFRRRPKSWVEKQPKNKKNQFSNTSQQQKQDKVIKLNGSISQLDEHGFNRLLMEPLDVFLQPNTFVNHQESL
ncbi:protein FAR1-RELATED SEQUENCE 5-like isoform X2 [Arachis hypogaea]|uniref:protein FAR1-RELATED SEQUENCE 5-like isoform X2 n=1 Tax=Arachis hypogaea TaxID=3818 RepID=UPI003B224408